VSEMVRFSFALNARMQSFLDVRDAIQCLEQARVNGDYYAWLHAACDLRASLLGDLGRKTATSEIVAILGVMQEELVRLAQEHPEFCDSIRSASNRIEGHMASLQGGLSSAQNDLAQDALLVNYFNAQKKQDLLGHRRCLPQSLPAMWTMHHERTETLRKALQPLYETIADMNDMLNDYVQWQYRTAHEGSDKITPDRQHQYGLLVIGIPVEQVAAGVVPDMSGNHLAIRIRFQKWPPLEPAMDVSDAIDYAYMLVPVA